MLFISTSISLFVFVTICSYLIITILRTKAGAAQHAYIEKVEADLDEVYSAQSVKDIVNVGLIFGLVLGMLFYFIFNSIILMVLAFTAGFASSRLYLNISKKKRLNKIGDQLADALDLIVNGLKAGMSPNQAFIMASKEMPNPISQEFQFMARELSLGISLNEALQNLEDRVDSQEVSIMVRSTLLNLETGGDLTTVFNKIAHTVRQRLEVNGKLKAMTAEGNFQAISVGIMPLFIFIIMYFVSPELVEPLLTTTIGNIILIFAIVLEGLGFLTIRKISKIDF